MPKTGCSHGHPKVTHSTCLRTSNQLFGPGQSREGCSLPRKKKNGMSTISLAHLDRLIPITSGGKPILPTKIMDPNWTLGITIIFWYALAVTCVKTQSAKFSKYTMLHPHNWNTVQLNMKGVLSDKKFEDLLMTSWLSILIKSMLQSELCRQNATVPANKQSLNLDEPDSVSLNLDPDSRNYIVECIYSKKKCPACRTRGRDQHCENFHHSEFGWCSPDFGWFLPPIFEKGIEFYN